jgi:uncharacterized protein YegP (UPF0339 family)
MKIEVFQGRGTKARPGLWFWHLRQTNGKVVAQGEGHPKRAGATRAAKAVVNGIIKEHQGISGTVFWIKGRSTPSGATVFTWGRW